MDKILNSHNLDELSQQFLNETPFKHVVIDNFFKTEIAEELVKEFPSYNDESIWDACYNNPIEIKKASNHWNKFPRTTYQIFSYLCSADFVSVVADITKNKNVIADIGLHGGGWHSHSANGKLNIHLDYSIHPKLDLERHYNLIVYMTPNWDTQWGGGLELWSGDKETNLPKQRVKVVENKFNRAILFDTTDQSWHGLPKELNCPPGVFRQSLAIYYVSPASENADPRQRALFAPFGDQKNDQQILDLIRKRNSLLR